MTVTRKRKYASAVRGAAKRDTRDRILDAVVDVVTREGVQAFTIQNVADAAGVAHRTVYRHFATREALLDGLDEMLDRRAAQAGISPVFPVDPADLPQAVGAAYRSFDVYRNGMRAYVIMSIALGRRVRSFDRRTRSLRAILARAFPGLDREEARAAAGVLRLLGSTRAWFLLTTEQDMTTAAAARAVSWAMDVLLADLDARSKKRAAH